MKYATTIGLKLWEIGLNNLFFDFYRILYKPNSDRRSCFEAMAEYRGYVTALWYSDTITESDKDILIAEVYTMIDLIFDLKSF